jgi:hypothetical protein
MPNNDSGDQPPPTSPTHEGRTADGKFVAGNGFQRNGSHTRTAALRFRNALATASTPDRVHMLVEALWTDALEGEGLDRQFAIKTILERVMGPPQPAEEERIDRREFREAVLILLAAGMPAEKLPPIDRLPPVDQEPADGT